MKSVAGKMRLELAQYRELAAFAQFGSELDAATATLIEKGRRTTEVFKQPQYQPLSEPMQIASIWAVTNGYMNDVPIAAFQRFEKEYHGYLKTHHKDLVEALSNGEKLNEQTIKKLTKATEEFKKVFGKS